MNRALGNNLRKPLIPNEYSGVPFTQRALGSDSSRAILKAAWVSGLPGLACCLARSSKANRWPTIDWLMHVPRSLINRSRHIPIEENCDRSPRDEPLRKATATSTAKDIIQFDSSTPSKFGC